MMKSWLDFGHNLIFKVTVGLKTAKSHIHLAEMLPNLHVYIIGAGSIAD